ncbi:MAG TPA: GGDEF domain-containing protein [Burkholderiaceae bacterium]|nr:GGDEF domain-containing protein [Burkholderiaceae bacterium]
MKLKTDETLLEQMHINELELEQRKALYSFSEIDREALQAFRPMIDERIDPLVERFYEQQTSIPEIALLIGDADTLSRLRSAQRRYILDLFSGRYDLDYVNNRLRIGLVHKRIGVEPKLYLAAVHSLKQMLRETIQSALTSNTIRDTTLSALDKLMQIDVTFIFETYIRSLLFEIEVAKERAERFGRDMEKKVHDRTVELQQIARTDPMTGLLNVRHLGEIVSRDLRAAERRQEPIAAIYIDVDDFKAINDTHGHQKGDEILRMVGTIIRGVTRFEDSCFRYGGDEFCVFLINCDAANARKGFVAKLTDRILESGFEFSVSVGIAQTGPTDYLDAFELIKRADRNMYAAKQERKAAAAVR